MLVTLQIIITFTANYNYNICKILLAMTVEIYIITDITGVDIYLILCT